MDTFSECSCKETGRVARSGVRRYDLFLKLLVSVAMTYEWWVH